MSHIVQIETEVRDRLAIEAACRRLGLKEPAEGVFKLYSDSATGVGVELPGWRYPVVCDLGSGKVRYDNFDGHWGDQKDLNRFLQAYAVEKCRLEARRKGHEVAEQHLPDGSIRLTVQVGAGS